MVKLNRLNDLMLKEIQTKIKVNQNLSILII